jgi:hypothetical protein
MLIMEYENNHTGHGTTWGQDAKIYTKVKMSKIILTLNQDAENYFNPKPICSKIF